MVSLRRGRQAPHQAAVILGPHQARVDDASGGERVDQAGRTQLAELGIDLHLGEHRAERMHRGSPVGAAIVLDLDVRQAGTFQDGGHRLALLRIVGAQRALGRGEPLDHQDVGAVEAGCQREAGIRPRRSQSFLPPVRPNYS